MILCFVFCLSTLFYIAQDVLRRFLCATPFSGNKFQLVGVRYNGTFFEKLPKVTKTCKFVDISDFHKTESRFIVIIPKKLTIRNTKFLTDI